MWYIGQKVACVNDKFPLRILEWTSDLPRKGRIYTIRSMGRGHSLYNGELRFGFRFEELRNGSCGFFAERFAPLVEQLAEVCQRKASEITSPAWVETPVLTPAVPAPRAQSGTSSRSPAPRRRCSKKVKSENAAIKNAVLRAAAYERRKSAFTLFGRNHEPRINLAVAVAAILRGLDLPRVYISGFGANYYYPRRVFTRAIRNLKRKLGHSPIAQAHIVYRIREESARGTL